MITITIPTWLVYGLMVWYFLVNYIQMREGIKLIAKHITGLFS